MFDFNVRHIIGKKYIVADALSRRGRSASDDINKAVEEDINKFLTREIDILTIYISTLLIANKEDRPFKVDFKRDYLTRPTAEILKGSIISDAYRPFNSD